MIAQLAVGMAAPVEVPADPAEEIKRSLPILIAFEDRLAPFPAQGHVIQTTGQFNAEGSCHGVRPRSEMCLCKT